MGGEDGVGAGFEPGCGGQSLGLWCRAGPEGWWARGWRSSGAVCCG